MGKGMGNIIIGACGFKSAKAKAIAEIAPEAPTTGALLGSKKATSPPPKSPHTK